MVFGESGRVLRIVVRIEDVGDDVMPAAGVNDRARRIQTAGRMVDGGDEIAVLVALRFVQWTPTDDAGVAVITFDDFFPLRQEAEQRRFVGNIEHPVGVFIPAEIAELIRPIEEARFKDLLVQARAVEAHRHGAFDVGAQFAVIRRRIDAVRVEALIENEALEDDLPVDAHGFAVEIDVAHAEVALHTVAGGQRNRQVIQAAAARFPQFRRREIERQLGGAPVGMDGLLCLFCALIRGRHGHFRRFSGSTVEQNGDMRAFIGDVRRHAQRMDIRLRDVFHPDGLPDAGRPRVAAFIGMIPGGLFARGLRIAADIVFRADGNAVFAKGQQFRHVEDKRAVSAAVRPGRYAVDPNFRRVVDGAEVQQDAAGCLPAFRQCNRPRVPDGRHKIGICDAAQAAFRAERDADGLLERLRRGQAAFTAAAAKVHFKGPVAVQIDPCFTGELRFRMFRAGNVLSCHCSFSFRWIVSMDCDGLRIFTVIRIRTGRMRSLFLSGGEVIGRTLDGQLDTIGHFDVGVPIIKALRERRQVFADAVMHGGGTSGGGLNKVKLLLLRQLFQRHFQQIGQMRQAEAFLFVKEPPEIRLALPKEDDILDVMLHIVGDAVADKAAFLRLAGGGGQFFTVIALAEQTFCVAEDLLLHFVEPAFEH